MHYIKFKIISSFDLSKFAHVIFGKTNKDYAIVLVLIINNSIGELFYFLDGRLIFINNMLINPLNCENMHTKMVVKDYISELSELSDSEELRKIMFNLL